MTTATDPTGLAQIEQAIQDKWFDLDEVVADQPRAAVRVKIHDRNPRAQARRSDAMSSPSFELIVRGVSDVVVNDDAGIGWFDVGSVTYEPQTHVVIIRSNFPLEVRATVASLDVELIEL